MNKFHRNNFNPNLDLLRGILGYGIITSHFFFFYNSSIFAETISILCVDIFFVLSGYVLAPQVLNFSNSDSSKQLKVFYLRRWMRTLPLYFVVVIFIFTLLQNINISDLIKYLTFTAYLKKNFLQNDFFPVAWSLCVEELYYLIMPIIVLVIKKNVNKLFIFLSFVGLFFVLFYDLNHKDFRTLTFFSLTNILIGLIIFININNWKSNKYKILFYVFALLLFFNSLGKLIDNDSLIMLSSVWGYDFFAIIVFIFFLNFKLPKYNFLIKFYKFLSNQTYSLYLWHLPVLYILKFYNINSSIKLFCIYIFINFVISYLSYELFEKIILSKRPKYLKDDNY